MAKFTIDSFHRALLKRLHFEHTSWSFEHGAPAVNEKRPYGNSDVDRDLAEIFVEVLKEKHPGERVELIVDEREEETLILIDGAVHLRGKPLEDFLFGHHNHMATVLQILAVTGKNTGTFEQGNPYDVLSWVEVTS